MSTPPAHRRLVPRKPRPSGESPAAAVAPGAAGPDEDDPQDEHDATVRRPTFSPDLLALDDPAPHDSMTELTIERIRPAPAPPPASPARPPASASSPPPTSPARRPASASSPPPASPARRPASSSSAPPLPPPPAPPERTALEVPGRRQIARAPGPAAQLAARAAKAPRPPPALVPRPLAPGPGASFSDSEPTTLRAADTTGIEDRPTTHLSPAEIGLLAAIAEGHEPSRKLYADWLERRGEPIRAEFLRLDHALHAMQADDPRFTRIYVRLREVAQQISVDWRSRVSRASIEACAPFGAICPGLWRALPADADDVRTCGVCRESVYYCVTLQLARDRVQHGQRVALDTTCERWPGDLDRQCDSCSAQVPPQNRFCPSCGAAMSRARPLGT